MIDLKVTVSVPKEVMEHDLIELTIDYIADNNLLHKSKFKTYKK